MLRALCAIGLHTLLTGGRNLPHGFKGYSIPNSERIGIPEEEQVLFGALC